MTQPRVNLLPRTIGLDLGSKKSAFCILGPDGEICREGSIPMSRSSVERFLSAEPTSRVVVEACGVSRWTAEIARRNRARGDHRQPPAVAFDHAELPQVRSQRRLQAGGPWSDPAAPCSVRFTAGMIGRTSGRYTSVFARSWSGFGQVSSTWCAVVRVPPGTRSRSARPRLSPSAAARLFPRGCARCLHQRSNSSDR